MLTILWFLFVTFLASISLTWILDHNGVVLVNWLGYEAKTDILTAILIAAIFTIIIFIFSYFLARILSLKFPNLFKTLFKKSYTKKLEALIQRHWQGFEIITQLLLSLENEDSKTSIALQKKLAKSIKNPHLHNFLLGKIYYQNKDYSRAHELFSKIENNKSAQIMALDCKLEISLEKQDNLTAIVYAKQILELEKNNSRTIKKLLALYKKEGLEQEAKSLTNNFNL